MVERVFSNDFTRLVEKFKKLNISYVCVCILGTPVIILRILNGTRCSNIKLRVNNIYRVFALLVSVFLVNDKWEEESGGGRETNGSKSTT